MYGNTLQHQHFAKNCCKRFFNFILEHVLMSVTAIPTAVHNVVIVDFLDYSFYLNE